MDQTIEIFLKKGWLVAAQSSEGVQFLKPRQWSQFLLLFGISTACFGFGFLILVLAGVDYLIKKDKAVFVPRGANHPVVPPPDNQAVIIIGLILIAITVICFACVFFGLEQPTI